MPDLVFTIKTPAELSGAEAAAKLLEVNIGKAKALGKEYADLKARLDDVNASIATYKSSLQQTASSTDKIYSASEKHVFVAQELSKGQADLSKTTGDLEKNVKTATGSTDGFTNSKKSLAAGLKGVAVVFPGFAQGIHLVNVALKGLAANPLVLMFIALIAALKLIIDLFGQWRAHLKAIEMESLTDGVEKARNAARRGADDFKGFIDRLNETATAQDKITTATDNAIRALNDQSATNDRVAESEKKAGMARLKGLHATGQITDEEFQQRSAALDSSYAQSSASRAKDKRAAEEKILAEQLKQTADARDAAVTDVSKKTTAHEEAAGELAALERMMENTKSRLEKYKEKSKTTWLTREEIYEERSDKRSLIKFEEDLPAYQQRADAAADAKAKAQAAATASDDAHKKQKEALAQRQALLAATNAADQKVVDTERQAQQRPELFNDASRGFQKAQDIARRIKSGGTVTKEEKEFLRSIGSNLSGSNLDFNQSARVFDNLDKSINTPGFGQASSVADIVASGGRATPQQQGVVDKVASQIAGKAIGGEDATRLILAVKQREAQFIERLVTLMEKSGGVNAGLNQRLERLEAQVKNQGQQPR